MPDGDPAQIAALFQAGLPWRPRLSRMWNADWQRTVFAPLVQAGEVSPWAKLEPNYISALLAEPHIEQLILARPDPHAPLDATSLLQTLLRHALLREIAYAAARLQADETGADLLPCCAMPSSSISSPARRRRITGGVSSNGR